MKDLYLEWMLTLFVLLFFQITSCAVESHLSDDLDSVFDEFVAAISTKNLGRFKRVYEKYTKQYPNLNLALIHNRYYETLLHKVAMFGTSDMIDFLVDNGADIYARNNRGIIAMELITYKGSPKITALLRATLFKIVELGDLTDLKKFKKNYSEDFDNVMHSRGARGETALHRAAKAGQLTVIEWILENYSELLECYDNDELTAKDWAIRYNQIWAESVLGEYTARHNSLNENCCGVI